MAGFVDCTKYNKEQQEQDTRIENLEKREIVHDETLKGGGIDKESPLGLNTSADKDNAIKADKNGVYVKDLEPQVEKLEEALKNKYDRLGNDLGARIRELNGRLNALKDIEVALAAAKAEGNYNKIKELEARLQAAKEAQQTGDKGLAEAIEALRKQGLPDEEIRKIIADAIAKAGGNGRYITRIDTNQNDGTVAYYYSDGTSVTGKLANFGGVVADQRSIVGNGHDKALQVNLSKQSGNLIEIRQDGIYYGTTAEYPDLYIDAVNGSDENIGTRDKPLRTFLEAAKRNKKGVTVRYWFKEDMDHRIDTTVFLQSGEHYIYPYGEFFDNLPKTHGSTDFFQQNLDIVKYNKGPRLVFSGAESILNPSNESSTPQVRVYSTNRIQVPKGSSLSIEGIHLVNDLNFTIDSQNMAVRGTSTTVYNPSRINLSAGSTLEVINVSFETRGRPIINMSESDKAYVRAHGEPSYALLEPKNGLYRVSFIADIETAGASVGLRNTKYGSTERTMECFVYGCWGWGIPPKATSQVGLTSDEHEWLAKHMDGVVVDDDSKTVIKPKTDILYKYFK